MIIYIILYYFASLNTNFTVSDTNVDDMIKRNIDSPTIDD